MKSSILLNKISEQKGILCIFEKMLLIFEKYPNMYFDKCTDYDEANDYYDTTVTFEDEENDYIVECRNGAYESDIEDIFKDFFNEYDTFCNIFKHHPINFFVDKDFCIENINKYNHEIFELSKDILK